MLCFRTQTTIGLAVTGFSTLYGRMSPYLHRVALEEHYFIQGPRNAKSDALSIFAKLGRWFVFSSKYVQCTFLIK